MKLLNKIPIALLIVFSILSIYAVLGMIIGNSERFFFLVVSSLSMLIILLPIVMKNGPIDIFSPIMLVAGYVALGTGLRVPYILYFYDISDKAEFLMFTMQFDQLYWGAIWTLVGICAFAAGYIAPQQRLAFERIPYLMNYHFNRKKLLLLGACLAIFCSIMAVDFFSKAGTDLSRGLLGASSKVQVVHDLGDGIEQESAGVQRFLAQYASIPFVIIVCLIALGKIKKDLFSIATVIILAIPTVFVPFLASSRKGILLSFLIIFVFFYYFRLIHFRHVLLVAAFFVFIVVGMATLRYENKTATRDDWSTSNYSESIVEVIVGSGNGVDMMRTAGVITNIPDNVDYLFGKSYLATFAVYIPRGLWASKPEITLGPWTKTVVFQVPSARYKGGWPIGLIGESYANFGYFGIVLIMFFIGWCMRVFYNSFQPFLGKSVLLTLGYSCVVFQVAMTMGGNFAQGVATVLNVLVPFSLCMLLARQQLQRPMSSPRGVRRLARS